MTNTLHIYLLADDPLFSFDKSDFDLLRSRLPHLELKFIADESELVNSLPGITWLDTWRFKSDWYKMAPNLKAVITPAAGREMVANSPFTHCNTIYGTFHGALMAETALGLVLQHTLSLPQYQQQQELKHWKRLPSKLLRTQTALILGYGHIGQSCGQLLSSLGMRVIGLKRTPHNVSNTNISIIEPNGLEAALPVADHVISFLPGGPDTNHFVEEHFFGRMSESAYFYNFGRGSTVDESALVHALDQHFIAGAALDVTEIEPLPQESVLWTHPKITILPHSSAYYGEYRELHVMELTDLMSNLINRTTVQ